MSIESLRDKGLLDVKIEAPPIPETREDWSLLLSNPPAAQALIKAHGLTADGLVDRMRSAGFSDDEIRPKLVHIRDYFKNQRLRVDGERDRVIETIAAGTDMLDVKAGASKTGLLQDKLPVNPADGTRNLRMKDMIAKNAAFGDTVPKVVETIMNKSFPQLVKMFYPRVYGSVGNYHSPRQVSLYIANVLAEVFRYGRVNAPVTYQLMLPAMKYLVDHHVPMFFLAPDFLEAILRTDFADDIDWVNLKLPYEHGLFILPRGMLQSPRDGEVGAIMWSRVQKGQGYPPPIKIVSDTEGSKWGLETLYLDNTAFAVLALCPETGVWFDSCMSAGQRPTLRLNNMFYRGENEALPAHLGEACTSLEDGEDEFLEKLGVVTFGAFLAMNARPELVDKARMEKRVKSKDGVREFWSPNIVGKRYKIRREVPKIVGGEFRFGNEERGTHASPRLHFRRGHFRNQACGAGRRDHKTIWIEPCLIGAKHEA